jgi:membrane-associated phospholipid phosphatase
MVMDRKERATYALVVLAISLVWGLLYTAIGEIAWRMEGHSFETAVDRMIPFVPEFEYAYLLCYILPVVPVLVIRDRRSFNRLLLGFAIISGIAFIFFLAYPVRCPRPEVNADTLATSLLAAERLIDRPVNNLPSLHAAVAMLAYLSCRGYSRLLDVLMLLAMAGICAGALFVKQHFVADIVAGLALSWGVAGFLAARHRSWGGHHE